MQLGADEIIGDDLRAGRQRGFDPRLNRQATLTCLLRDQSSGDHHRWVRGVGAARDRSNHDVTVLQLGVVGGDDVALKTWKLGAVIGLRVGQRNTVLRPARAGDRGNNIAQINRNRVGEDRLNRVGVVPEALRAGVGLDDFNLLFGATGEAQITDCLSVDREDCAGRPKLRAHVAERGAVGKRELRNARAVELNKRSNYAALTQQLGDGQH